jgi:hypothetical protein
LLYFVPNGRVPYSRTGDKGKPFDVEKIKLEDLKAGQITSSWVPILRHPSVPEEQVEAISRIFIVGSIISSTKGAWTVSDEWNVLLPDYKFANIEDFLSTAWEGRP